MGQHLACLVQNEKQASKWYKLCQTMFCVNLSVELAETVIIPFFSLAQLFLFLQINFLFLIKSNKNSEPLTQRKSAHTFLNENLSFICKLCLFNQCLLKQNLESAREQTFFNNTLWWYTLQ